MDDYTPADFWSGFWKWSGVGLFIAALLGGLVVVGWQAGWWFSNQNNNRNYQQTQNGDSNQEALRQQMGSNFTLLAQDDVAIAKAQGNPGLTGQYKVEAAATAAQLCDEGTRVNSAVPLDPHIAAWLRLNCSMGVVAPASKYFIPG